MQPRWLRSIAVAGLVDHSKMVERIGVAKASKPSRRVSPNFMAASHRKNAPPKGPNPNTAISRMSSVLSDTEGSSHTWQAKDKSPDAAQCTNCRSWKNSVVFVSSTNSWPRQKPKPMQAGSHAESLTQFHRKHLVPKIAIAAPEKPINAATTWRVWSVTPLRNTGAKTTMPKGHK